MPSLLAHGEKWWFYEMDGDFIICKQMGSRAVNWRRFCCFVSLVGEVKSETISKANFINTDGNRQVKWLVQVCLIMGQGGLEGFLSFFLPSHTPSLSLFQLR